MALILKKHIGTEGYFRDLKITKWPDSPAETAPKTSEQATAPVDRFFTTSDGVKLHYRDAYYEMHPVEFNNLVIDFLKDWVMQ